MAKIKSITFLGDSLSTIRDFPDEVKKNTGHQLDRVQRGLDPDDYKPMKSIGIGVREIRVKNRSGAFRTIYVVQKGDGLFVLHAFQKKSQKTSKQDLDIAKARLRQIR